MSSSKGRTKAVLTATAATTTLAAVALALTACSSTRQQAADLSPQSGSSVPSTADSAASQTPSSGSSSTGAPAADGKTFGGAPKADAALSSWMVALVKGDFPGACKFMGQKGKNGGAPTAPTQELCSQLTANKAGKDLLAGMQKTFTPAGASAASTSVLVTGVTPTGTTASANDTQVKVDGKLLRDVIIANSKGVPAGKSTATFQLTQIGKLWYVTDFGLQG